MMDYTIVLTPLSEEDGGGFIGVVPDLPGCMSDGETQSDALENTCAAVEEWLAAATQLNRPIPKPGSALKQMRRERSAMVAALQTMFDAYENLDDRVEAISRDLQNLREAIENNAAWERFGGIAGAEVVIPTSAAGRRPRVRMLS